MRTLAEWLALTGVRLLSSNGSSEVRHPLTAITNLENID